MSKMGSINGSGVYAGARRSLGGSGAYSFNQQAKVPFENNSTTMNFGHRFQGPRFQASAIKHDDGGLVIRNQEFISYLYGNEAGTTFDSVTYPINPGLWEICPLLSQIAANFHQYEMRSFVMHFETMLDAGVIQSSTGQIGEISMFSHTDINAADYQNAAEFAQNGGVSSKVTSGCVCGVECDRRMLHGLPNAGINFVRTGNKNGVDNSEYDQARVQVAVVNTPDVLAGLPLGKLYCSYEIRLIKPRIYAGLGRTNLTDNFTIINDSSSAATVRANGDKFLVFNPGYSYLNTSPESTLGCGIALATPMTSDNDWDNLTITIPSWAQGLFCVECMCINYASSGGPITLGSISPGEGAFEISVSGEVKQVNFGILPSNTTVQAGSGVNAGYGYNIDGALTNAQTNLMLKAYFRVSQALAGDNSIKLAVKHSGGAVTNLSGGDRANGTWATILSIYPINDFGAVGTKDILSACSFTTTVI
jgi:hypothetical protein